jgi:hypothetical protein
MRQVKARETGPRRWLLEDWREWREERAAILEYDAGLSRDEAEAMADEMAAHARRLSEPPRQAEMFGRISV